MPRVSTKKTTENQAIQNDKNSTFSRDCFVNGFPLETKSGEDIPMWWRVVRESGVSFKQYKKDKRRAEKEIAGLEEYLKKLEEENKKYNEKLKKESEKYKLECDMRSHAFEERRKKEELHLATEKEEAKKRVLEEKLQLQAKKFEQEKELQLQNEKLREEQAQSRYKESLAQIEQNEKEERANLFAKEGASAVQRRKSEQKVLDTKKRVELESAVERETVKKLRKAHKAKDYEFIYPRPIFGVKNNDIVIEFSSLCLKNKTNMKHISSPIYAEIGKGITVTSELSKREMKAVCFALTRKIPKDMILSGGARYKNQYLLHEMTAKKQVELIDGNINIVKENDSGLRGLKSVGGYVKMKVGEDKFDIAIDYLQRLNARSPKALMNKKAFVCTKCEIQKIELVCALLSNTEITVLIEPQRMFDYPTESALWQLIFEWQGGKEGRVLWVITSNEEFKK